MANEQNLKPFTSEQSREKARENGRKGGIASGEAKRQRKTMNELAAMVLNQQATDKDKKAIEKVLGKIDDEDVTIATKMMIGQIQSAQKGNTKAFIALTEMAKAEELKKQKEEEARRALLHSTYHLDLDMIPDNFHKAFRDIRNEKHQEYVFKGGRGSTKSSDIAQIIIELMKNTHDIHTVVCRKVGNTLKDSVYAKIKWAISMQHDDDNWEFKKSPLEIVYKPTGQVIYFRGADAPEKIKSIAPPFGYIAILWFEEIDQFQGAEEVRNITQSAIRGGNKAWIFKSFNPPKTKMNWMNKYVLETKDNMLVHHSDYLEVPEEWLGQPFIDEAEHLKEVNPEAYEHEYLGIPNGNGGAVFDNLEIRKITDEEIARFDNIRQGADWGYYPDPFAFTRWAYESAQETIYALDEYYVNKKSNAETGQWIIDKDYDDYPLTCDSAEPKSINDFRDLGLRARGARKGPGSIEYGMKWLQTKKIVIDPERTPNIYKEFTKYEFERDKEGNVISGYPDANNHSIDSCRYAFETYYSRRENHA